MKLVGGFSSLLVRSTVLQKSGLQNANLELCFDCYHLRRGRVQILALALLVPGEGCAVCGGCKHGKSCTGAEGVRS